MIMAIKRRDFIKNSALAAAGSFFIVPRHVLGRGFTAPSDMLNIAAVGAGGKGQSDILNAWDNGKNKVVALCDVDWVRATSSITKFSEAQKFRDFRVMFDKMHKDIDAVTVSTPDHNHATVAMAAMGLGKHVYVQKPLTHNIFEARTLTEAARKNKVVTQMGNQGASGPGVHQMVEWFDKGLIGTVHTVHVWTNRPVWPQGIPSPTGKPEKPKDLDWDTWIGPATPVDYHPGYHPFKWRGWWNFGTGALGDMACHLMDPPYRVLGLGYPTEVECSVGSVFLKDWTPEYIPDGCPPSSSVQLRFAPTKKNKSAVTLTWNDGGVRPFHPEWIPADDIMGDADGSNGAMLIGTKGVMICGTYGLIPKIYKKNGEKMEMPKADPSVKMPPENGHQMAWTEACKAGFNSDKHKALTSSFDYAGPLTETILMGNLAIRSYGLRVPKAGSTTAFDNPGRKKLLWDGTNMRITNFEEANQFVKREYRQGWAL
jgi:predicted dehydrogenase